MHVRQAIALLLVTLVTAPFAGCVSNMGDLRATLGFAPPPVVVPDPLPPVAVAEANVTLVVAGERVRFEALESHDPDGVLVGHAWSFGDDASAAGERVEHAFAAGGEYRVTLIVTDDTGLTATDDVLVTVKPKNRAPEAAFAVRDASGRAASSADAGASLTFASFSYDPDNDALEVAWDFGDGATSLAPVARHAFAEPGEYLVTLVARDPSGASSRATRLVAVNANVTYPAGEFPATPGEESRTLALEVPRGAALVRVSVSFDASYGVSDLSLALLDASGADVGRADAETKLGERGEAEKSIALTREILDAHAPGAWSIVVTRTKGLAVDYQVRSTVQF